MSNCGRNKKDKFSDLERARKVARRYGFAADASESAEALLRNVLTVAIHWKAQIKERDKRIAALRKEIADLKKRKHFWQSKMLHNWRGTADKRRFAARRTGYCRRQFQGEIEGAVERV